jgi:hypothetical protein
LTVSTKWLAPPSIRSSLVTEVITAYLMAKFFTASEILPGSAGSSGVGLPQDTPQNEQPLVQIFPQIRKVAVFFAKHSPMFGQSALSHTVLRPRARSCFFNSVVSDMLIRFLINGLFIEII